MSDMRITTQFSIFLVNKPGVMANVTTALADAGVNLFAHALSDSGEHGILRIICNQPEKAREVLREAHDRWTETDVIVIPIENEPGTFAKLVEKLAAKEINVAYSYCTANETGGSTTVIIKVADAQASLAALKA